MAFCANCGAAVEGRFCQKCGAAVAAAGAGGTSESAAPPPAAAPATPGAPGAAPVAAATGMTDNAAGALSYLLGLITGILFLVLAPYNQNRTVRFHAFQSIFLNIAWIIAWIILTIISTVLFTLPVLGAMLSILLHFALWIGGLIVWLYLMFKTYNGEKIVLPVIGPMAEKQAGA